MYSCARFEPPSFPASPSRYLMIGTFGVMYLLHYSLDNLSLMALAISTGFVVDDADRGASKTHTRFLEQGMHPVQAAYSGRA